MKKAFFGFLLFFAFFSSYSQSFSLSDHTFKVGVYYRTYEIYFDLGKYTLDVTKSKPVLDSLVTFIKNNPSLSIEIGVHTDSRGSNIANTMLSQGRANSINDYFIAAGILQSRLKAVGYGESKLLIKDDVIERYKTKEEQEAQHQKNRRVEFKIISISQTD